MGLLAAQNVAAATNYDLYVGGQRVTSDNKGNIKPSTSSWLKSGKITYDPSTSTLTFTNVNLKIDVDQYAVKNTGITDLTIRFVGNDSIRSYGTVIYSAHNLTISGGYGYCASAYLEFNNPDASHTGAVIYVRNGKNLTVADCHLTMKGNKAGIYGETVSDNNANGGECYFETAHVKLTINGTGYASAIHHFKKIYCRTNDTYFKDGRKYSNYMITDSSGNRVSSVETENWCYIDNVIVPNFGGDDWLILHPANTSGTVKWRQTDKRLVLEGCSYSGSNAFINNNSIDNLWIYVGGTNNIAPSSSQYVIYTKKSMKILGNYTTYTSNVLNATSKGASCIRIDGSGSLSFQNLVATVKSLYTPMYGNGSSSLSINKCQINTTATGSGTSLYGISNFGSCTMTDARCWNAQGCFRKAKKAFATPSAIIKDVDIRVPTTYYDVYVLGQQLTNVDKSYPGIEGLTGSVVYDSDNKMIKLNNVEITPPSGDTNVGLKFYGSAASVVDLTGTNKIKAANNAIWSVSGDVTFQGSGSLTAEVTSGSYSCYYVGTASQITFNVESPVYFTGGTYGIYSSSESCKLKLQKASGNTDYFFKGINEGPIKNFADLTLSGVDFYTVGTYYDKTNRVLKRNDGQNFPANTYVDIDAYSTQYSIWVVGRKLNDVNARGLGSANITGPNTAVTYDSTNKILTLNGGTLYCNTDHVIDVREPGVTIKVIGSNKTDIRQTKSSYTSTESHQYGINTTENLTITGTAQLDFNNNGDYNGINISSGKVLTIKDCYYVWTYFINGNSTGSLVVDNSHVYTNGYMHNLANLSLLNNVGIINPQLAKFDSSKKCVVNKDGVKCNSVRINKLESYGLYVCGTAVTNANNKDVLGNGVFVYDPSNKKLTVSGNASCSNNNIIYNPSVSGLEIYFSKTCTLTDTDTGSSAIYLGASTTFTSASNARVNITGSNYNGIYAYDSNTTITFDKVPNMNITANGYGICSYSNSNVLNIKSSYMSVDATSSVISGWKSINLTGCKITSPSGAKVVGGKVTNSSGSVLTNKKVIIEGVATGIDDVEAAPETELATPEAIYDTEGRQIQDMKRGVNIVRMPDGTIRKVMKK